MTDRTGRSLMAMTQPVDGAGRELRLHGVRDLRLHRSEPVEPAPGEVLVRVSAVGLCGSDRHWWEEGQIGDARLSRPLVLGHEIAGVIASGPRTGERVAVDPAIPCEACEPCRAGQSNLCIAVLFAGHGSTDGGLRDWLSWPERHLHPLPDGSSDAAGAMLEPLGIALHAMDLAPVHPGDRVAVVGCGPIGLLLIQLARLAGASWIGAIDPLEHRLAAARAFGAAAIDAEVERGMDVTFEAAGAGAAIETAIEVAHPGSNVVVVGIPSDDRIVIRASVARRKELTIVLARRMRDTHARAVDLVARGAIDVESLVTHRFPLEQGERAFGVLERREGIKVLVESAPSADIELPDDL